LVVHKTMCSSRLKMKVRSRIIFMFLPFFIDFGILLITSRERNTRENSREYISLNLNVWL
jgi:hypothetical protein